jgi:hypothetical protein
MSSLGVHADPDGWLHAGYSIKTALDQAEYDLDTADGSGGTGLRGAWSGPVAGAYQATWSRRRNRYQDMIAHARRAESALIDFGERLAGLQWRAHSLEQHWLGLGLHLSADGMRFALPWGHENLPHEVLASLRGWLDESERDIEAMWSDIKGAVEDVVTVLESVVATLADFEMIGLGAIGWVLSSTWDDVVKHPFLPIKDVLEEVDGWAGRTALNAWFAAKEVGEVLAQDGDGAAQDIIDAAKANAQAMHDAADEIDGYTEIGGKALLGVAIVATAMDTYNSIRKDGADQGLEENAGKWASLAAGVAVTGILTTAGAALIAVGAPELLVGVGVVAVGAVVSMGVGKVVQSVVDHHKKGVTRALDDIGQGAEKAAIWGAKETGLTPEPAS